MRIEEVKKMLFAKFGENRVDIVIPAGDKWVVSIDGEDQPTIIDGDAIRGLNENDEQDAQLLSLARKNYENGNFY